MTDFTIATFNVKNLIGADKEYYRFERYSAEEYAWKKDWLADQLLSLDADIICFQEVFEIEALRDVIEEANRRAAALNEAVVPDKSKRYHRKAIFRRIATGEYPLKNIRFAPNVNDGRPGERRPGLAIVSRFGFDGEVEAIQDLARPLDIDFRELSGEDGGSYRISRLSRPMQHARIRVGKHRLSIFNVHLKSKLGEFIKPKGARFPAEADLTRYDPYARALGELRATVRRMGEALVLREAILKALGQGHPVLALGDFNDSENAVSSAIVTGERPFRNYSWMRRHDAKHDTERYSKKENAAITKAVNDVRLISAEKHFIRKSLRDMVYTSAFGGVYESIDQILMSQHFNPENNRRIGELDYLSVLNDHLTDGAHPEAPYNKLASDHGQLVAHISLKD